MDYEVALEKAVLEYAASTREHPGRNGDASVRIPGFMDGHVWAMAAQLDEKGLISVSGQRDDGGLGISGILESGAVRLKEIVAEEDAETEATRKRLEEAHDRVQAKKWWRRLGKNGRARA